MKKIIFYLLIFQLILLLLSPQLVLAADCVGDEPPGVPCTAGKTPPIIEPNNPTKDIQGAIGTIQRPPELQAILPGAEGIAQVLGNILNIIYAIAAIVFLFMMVMGAFQFMTSGGNKENVQAAQKRIMNALIGIVLLALTAPIVYTIGRLTGFKFFNLP